MKDMMKEWVKGCDICMKHQVKPTLKPGEGRYPLITQAGREIVIDYTDMIERHRGYRYLLMCMDTYTGWPEAFPTRKEDSGSGVKFLINHYIPRHWFPEKIRSDNGAHFKSQELQKVESMLGLRHSFGTVYHPQSQGKVERLNQNVKSKLAKICRTRLGRCSTHCSFDHTSLSEQNHRFYPV